MNLKTKYTQQIKTEAQRLGFSFCGISKAESEHNDILQYCKEGNIEQAVITLKQHILGSRDEIKAFLHQREAMLK